MPFDLIENSNWLPGNLNTLSSFSLPLFGDTLNTFSVLFSELALIFTSPLVKFISQQQAPLYSQPSISGLNGKVCF